MKTLAVYFIIYSEVRNSLLDAKKYRRNSGKTAEQSVNGQAEDLAEKSRNQSKKLTRKTGVYYSFLTLVLLLCLVQVGFGAILNISKIISYKAKINIMEKVRDDAELRNKDLKTDIKQFSKSSSLEEIARNNLKMAGEDEVLIIINNNQEVQGKNVKNKKKSENKEKRSTDAG